jgi:hypothetical protein
MVIVPWEYYNVLCDKRLEIFCCIFCGDKTESRDHVISKVFLDKPYPNELPTIGACIDCNRGFSMDEEYLACLIECVLSGTTNYENIKREKVRHILKRKPSLVIRLKKSKKSTYGQICFIPENDRVKNIIIKIAKALIGFELTKLVFQKPFKVSYLPIPNMTQKERLSFERLPDCLLWPEIGTRTFQRMVLGNFGMGKNAIWCDVQPGRFRFSAIHLQTEIIIRFVISEYLACEVVWDDD